MRRSRAICLLNDPLDRVEGMLILTLHNLFHSVNVLGLARLTVLGVAFEKALPAWVVDCVDLLLHLIVLVHNNLHNIARATSIRVTLVAVACPQLPAVSLATPKRTTAVSNRKLRVHAWLHVARSLLRQRRARGTIVRSWCHDLADACLHPTAAWTSARAVRQPCPSFTISNDWLPGSRHHLLLAFPDNPLL